MRNVQVEKKKQTVRGGESRQVNVGVMVCTKGKEADRESETKKLEEVVGDTETAKGVRDRTKLRMDMKEISVTDASFYVADVLLIVALKPEPAKKIQLVWKSESGWKWIAGKSKLENSYK